MPRFSQVGMDNLLGQGFFQFQHFFKETSIECAGKNDSGKLKNSRVKIEKVFGKNAIHSSFTFLHLYNKKEKCSLFSMHDKYKAALLGLLMLSLCSVILFKVGRSEDVPSGYKLLTSQV